MRRAILLTGALRTIRKTIRFFKRNVLTAVDRHEIAVFACVQNDTQESEDVWTEWLKGEIGPCLLEVTWFSLDRFPGWVAHREMELENIVLGEAWKDYLRKSGSMIEYFQLQLAYMKLCWTEAKGGFRYDYVVRARTDSIYAKPVDFHWLDWTEEQVGERWQRIQEVVQADHEEVSPPSASGPPSALPQEVFKYFMCTLWSEDVIPNIPQIRAEYVPGPTESTASLLDTSPAGIRRYLHEGRYILTIRKNNLYVVRRDLFHFVPTLGTMYGFLRSPHSDAWWFNAEGQFRDACYYSCMSIFEYSSLSEERSLAYPSQWVETDFFEAGEVRDPMMVYCVVRR